MGVEEGRGGERGHEGTKKGKTGSVACRTDRPFGDEEEQCIQLLIHYSRGKGSGGHTPYVWTRGFGDEWVLLLSLCARLSVPMFVTESNGPDSLLFLTSVPLTAGSGDKLWQDVMRIQWDGMQHGRRPASRFVAEIRAWGYAVSGLDEVLLMGRTRTPRSMYISVGGKSTRMRRRAACCIFFNTGNCRFSKAFRLIDGQTGRWMNDIIPYRKVCHISYSVMSIRQPPPDSSDR